MTADLDRHTDDLLTVVNQIEQRGIRIGPKWRVISPAELRWLRDLADRMRRDASVTPNAKPVYVGSRAPVSGGREVCVVRERRR